MTTANRPRPLSALIPGLTKGCFGKKSPLFGKMLAEWTQIAGADIADKTTPLDLKFSRQEGSQQAVLHLAVDSAYALEFTYQKALLIERLNVFFGYPAIKDIKITQNSEIMDKKYPAKAKTRPVTAQEQQKIDAQVAGIQENDLQIALKNLGKAILSRRE